MAVGLDTSCRDKCITYCTSIEYTLTIFTHTFVHVHTSHTYTHTTRRFKSVSTDARQTDFSLSYFFSLFSLTFSSRFPLRFRAFPSASRLTRSGIARFSPLSRVDSYTRVHLSGKNQRKGREAKNRNFILIGL